MAPYRILSLDGGGIRGIITLVLLQRLDAHPALSGWIDSVDLIAGTSTGGLIALGLAYGLDFQEMRDLYEKNGADVFDDSWLDDLIDLGKLRGADYDIKNLRRELRRQFGNATLSKLKRRVLITAFDLDNESPDRGKRTWKSPSCFTISRVRTATAKNLPTRLGSIRPPRPPTSRRWTDTSMAASTPTTQACARSPNRKMPGSEKDRKSPTLYCSRWERVRRSPI